MTLCAGFSMVFQRGREKRSPTVLAGNERLFVPLFEGLSVVVLEQAAGSIDGPISFLAALSLHCVYILQEGFWWLGAGSSLVLGQYLLLIFPLFYTRLDMNSQASGAILSTAKILS